MKTAYYQFLDIQVRSLLLRMIALRLSETKYIQNKNVFHYPSSYHRRISLIHRYIFLPHCDLDWETPESGNCELRLTSVVGINSLTLLIPTKHLRQYIFPLFFLCLPIRSFLPQFQQRKHCSWKIRWWLRMAQWDNDSITTSH